MLTKLIGIDFQAIFLTMLALVGLYLILTRASAVNALVKSIARSTNESLVILQGRNVTGKSGVYA